VAELARRHTDWLRLASSAPRYRSRRLPDEPVVYLGQSNGQFVLFDLERKETLRARENLEKTDIGAPDRVPLRIPSSGLTQGEMDVLRVNGGERIRTSEGGANRFTAGPLWPLGYSPGGRGL
jgi:hypothetical protein